MAASRTSPHAAGANRASHAGTQRYDAPAPRNISRYDAPSAVASHRIDVPPAHVSRYRAPGSRGTTTYNDPAVRARLEVRA